MGFYYSDGRLTGGFAVSGGNPFPGFSFGFDFTMGALPAGFSFARASIGTYIDPTGTLQTVGNDVCRFDCLNGVPYLLIEGSATNLLLQSNNFAASWSTTNSSSLGSGAFTSPDGTVDGWSLTNTTANGGINQPITFLNVPYTISVWATLLAGTPTYQFQLAATTSISLGVDTPIFRTPRTLTPAAGPSFAWVTINTSSPGDTIGIFGTQLEIGSKISSYIPTTSSTVTRADDLCTFTIPPGTNYLTFTFDDTSTQVVSVTPGSYTIPTNLNRTHIKSITGSAALIVSDTFSRLPGPLGSNWTTITNSFAPQVTTGFNASFRVVKGSAVGYNAAYWSANAFGPDHCSQIIAMSRTHGAGAVVRASAAAETYYHFSNLGNSNWQLYKRIAGVDTQIGSDYAAAVSGDIVQLCVSGATLTPFINGVPQAQQTDTDIASGQPGMVCFDTIFSIDNFVANG